MRKNIKRGLAAALAAMLMVPAQPALASKQSPPDASEEEQLIPEEIEEEELADEPEKATPSEVKKPRPTHEREEKATPSEIEKREPEEEIIFNTGSQEVSVVSEEDFYDYSLGDACFDEDGSYTINIPEMNPFFPYEVQFTYDGEVTEEWFMTPDDSVEIGGHEFYVSAYFDNTAITQMTLNVAGDEVIVYPEEKEFTNDGLGISPMSLLPLEEQYGLTVDLTGYTPVELTMVAVDQILTGEGVLSADDSVMWSYGDDDFKVTSADGYINLAESPDFYYGYPKLHIIVGDESQLAAENIRYILSCRVTEPDNWLIPTVYKQNSLTGAGERTQVNLVSYSSDQDSVTLDMALKDSSSGFNFVGLSVNSEVFDTLNYDGLKAYKGAFDAAEDAEKAEDLTEQLFAADMSVDQAGYSLDDRWYEEEYEYPTFTLVSYQNGEATGCLPIELRSYYSETLEDWVVPTVYGQDNSGQRRQIPVVSSSSYERELSFGLPYSERKTGERIYLKLDVKTEALQDESYDEFRAFEGWYSSLSNWMQSSAEDITDAIFAADMSQRGAGYPVEYDDNITIIGYKDGKAVRSMPMTISYYWQRGSAYFDELFARTEDGTQTRVSTSSHTSSRVTSGIYVSDTEIQLSTGYPIDGEYYLKMRYQDVKVNESDPDKMVTAAYAGQYTSIAEARTAGAKDIKELLFGDEEAAGYAADYSQGVYFTIFVGEDDSDGQEIYQNCIKAVESSVYLSADTEVTFLGLNDDKGQEMDAYVVDTKEDSYGEFQYMTIFVGENTDLTKLAPLFQMRRNGMKLYAEGSNSPEISGVSLHDFSDGPVQYSASAENMSDAKNYWLQVIRIGDVEEGFYINSLKAQEAETIEENGIVYTTREVLLDSLHDDVHDILLANIGTETLKDLSVELVSDTVELDEYWTLNGGFDLEGFSTIDDTVSQYGELPNLSKIRLKGKEGTEGQDVTGTLTVMSEGRAIIIMT